MPTWPVGRVKRLKWLILLRLEGAGVIDGRDCESHVKAPRFKASFVTVAVLDRMFTGEESLGRFFDLVGSHADFMNLPPRRSRALDYLKYLDEFDAFEKIPRQPRAKNTLREWSLFIGLRSCLS